MVGPYRRIDQDLLQHRLPHLVRETGVPQLILVSGRAQDGPMTLTASAAPTFQDLAATASELTGRTVERVLVDEDRWVADQVAAGTPDGAVHFTLGFYQAAGKGHFDRVDPMLAELLGREPRAGAKIGQEPVRSR